MTSTADATASISPWASVWIRPRQAIRQVLIDDSELWLFVLAGVGGTLAMVDQLKGANAGDTMGLPGIAAAVLLGGPVAGVIIMYVVAAILRWTGKWFGGQAHSSEIAAAYAWSNVVQLPVLLLYVVLIALLGLSFFTDGFGEATASAGVVALLLGIGLAVIGFQLWSAVVFIVMLAEVQKFSLVKALLSVVAPGAILAIIVAIFWLA